MEGRKDVGFVLSILCVVSLAFLLPDKAAGIQVKIKDEAGRRFGSKSRSFPLRLTADVEGESTRFNLERNLDHDLRVPIFELRRNDLEESDFVQIHNNITTILYQDASNMASFGVVHKTSPEGTTAKIRGIIHKHNKVYDLNGAASSIDVPSVGATSPEEGEEFHLKVHDHHKDEGVSDGGEDVDTASTKESFSTQPHSRNRRAITQDVHIEVVALVDYSVYSAWYNRSTGSSAALRKQHALDGLYEYYAFVFNGVNMLYKTVTSLGHLIHVTLSSIVVMTTAQDSPWTEKLKVHEAGWRWDLVDANASLYSLANWTKVTQTLPPYDHVMLFTGYDLTNQSGSKTIAGRAFVGTVCQKDGKATSIIEDFGGLDCMTTSVHELGHGLSCSHDGDHNTCDSDDGFIMSTGEFNLTETNKLNRWKFSHCSLVYLNNYLTQTVQTQEGRNCLYRTLTSHGDIVDVTSRMPGQVYPIDEQCRQIRGPDSYFCRGMNVSKLSLKHWDDVCNSVYCYDRLDDLCHSAISAAQGTTCGDHMWCVDGQCVHNNAAPAVHDGCPFGDQPTPLDDGLTCAQVAAHHPVRCYRDWVRRSCCSSCAKVLQTQRLPGQLYDVDEQCRQWVGPDSYMCRAVNRTLFSEPEDVCDSLYCYNSTSDLCSSIYTADGTVCGHHKWCINDTCVSSTSAPAVNNNCPFGSQQGMVADDMTCAQIAQHWPVRCYQDFVHRVCCSVCYSVYQPGKVGGQVYDVDAQCRQRYGPQSYLCRGVQGQFLADGTFNCSKLSCHNSTDDLCYGSYAAMGTTCGDHKWCTEVTKVDETHVHQECVHNSSAPAVRDGCPLHDQSGPVLSGMTCSYIASHRPALCYNAWVRAACCSSCTPIYQPGKTPGQVYNVDAQCQQIFGPDSYMCRGLSGQLIADGTFNCSQLACHNKTDDLCYSINAAWGTTCGDHKWCTEATNDKDPICVHDASAPALTGGCVFGDQPAGLIADGKPIQCASYVDERPGRCYDQWTRSHCCASCARHRTTAHNCEYGDQATGCAPQYCSVTSNLPICCATCHYTPPNPLH